MSKRPLATVAAVLVILAACPAAPAFAEEALTLVAGTGTAGASGDGGPAAQAALNHPAGVAAAADGTLYIADTGNFRVRRVDPSGTITTVAGTGTQAAKADPLPPAAKGTDVALGYPTSLALGADGTLYIADTAGPRILALKPDGTITVRAAERSLGAPAGLAAAPDGTVFAGDHDGNKVLAIAPDGRTTEVAGNGQLRATVAGGAAGQVPVGAPNGLAVDTAGDVWISGGLLLRRLRGGQIATVTAPGADDWTTSDAATWPPPVAPLNNVQSVSAGTDGLYTIDLRARGLRRLGTDGTVRTVAELPEATFGALGPVELAAGAAPTRAVYLVDTTNSRVYAARVAPAGPGSPPDPDDPGGTVWPYVIGVAVVVLLAGVLVLLRVSRRRRS